MQITPHERSTTGIVFTLIGALVLALVSCVNTQETREQPETWQRVYQSPTNTLVIDAVSGSDGACYIAGYELADAPERLDLFLMKVDAKGAPLWKQTYRIMNAAMDDFIILAVTARKKGGVYLAGYTIKEGEGDEVRTDICVFHVDAAGTLVWRKEYDENDIEFVTGIFEGNAGAVHIVAQGLDYMVEAPSVSLTFLTLDEKDGSLRARNTQEMTSTATVLASKRLPDGAFLSAGFARGDESAGVDAFLMKTDAKGNGVWTKTFGDKGDESIYDLAVTKNGDILAMGKITRNMKTDVYLARLSDKGDVLFDRAIGGEKHDTERFPDVITGTVIETRKGEIAIASTTSSYGAGKADVYFIKTAADGTIIFEKTFGGEEDESGAACLSRDDGFIIAGTTKSFGDAFNVFLIRTDAEGNAGTLPTNSTRHTIP